MDNYRVFISYSHLDEDSIGEILEILEDNGLVSTYDKNLGAGMSFREQIESMISHSDVFVPVLSEIPLKQAGFIKKSVMPWL